MATSLVLTVIGADRPGLLEQLATVVAEGGGNWLDSRMAHLAGEFAGIVAIDVPEDRADPLLAALQALPGLTVQAKLSTPAAAPSSHALSIQLVGADRPGIVRDISRVLAELDINVEELTTATVSAPMTGEALFEASARVTLPADASADSLQARLEALANELMVDIHLD